MLAWTWCCQSREIWAGFFHLPFSQISVLSHKKQRQQVTQWKNLFSQGWQTPKHPLGAQHIPHTPAPELSLSPQGGHGDRHWDEEMASTSQSKPWGASPAMDPAPSSSYTCMDPAPSTGPGVGAAPAASKVSHLRLHQRASTTLTPHKSFKFRGYLS